MTIDDYMDEIINFGYNIQGYNNNKMTFAKYQFTNQAEWLTYQAQISTTVEGSVTYTDCAVHEIGQICLATDNEGNCTDLSPLYAVDILWNGEPLESFSTKEVFPNPIGVHTFSGCEDLYTKRYCEFNPNSVYCNITE
jgi:hypothetical protein